MAVYDIGKDDEPVRSLHLGPDRAGNLLEIVVLELDDGRWLVIHAMPCDAGIKDCDRQPSR